MTNQEGVATPRVENYTLADLELAKNELDALYTEREKIPGKWAKEQLSPQIHTANLRIALITESLKASGLLTRPEHETLQGTLDGLYPNARTKTTVE